MAKCVECDSAFEIPQEGSDIHVDPSQADDLAIEVLEGLGGTDGTTAVMRTLDEAEDLEETAEFPEVEDESSALDLAADETQQETAGAILERIARIAEEDPPDIGDGATPDEVKQLRRERHRLLLEVGREAFGEILSPTFEQFQERIKKIDKRARRIRVWLEAVDRASSNSNPVVQRMDMNFDPSKAAEQLTDLERDRHMALRALAEALIHADQHTKICPDQWKRIKAVDAKLDELIPPAAPEKNGLLSRFLGS